MKTDLFDYDLPGDLIALHPPSKRDGGRMMILEPASFDTVDAWITDLPERLPDGTLIVANDTMVIPARLRGRRITGGVVEILFVGVVMDNGNSCRFEALARSNRPLRPGDRIDIAGIEVKVYERGPRGKFVFFADIGGAALLDHLETRGETPLPPYIRRKPVPEDKERYQTVFADNRGSVAAPTAGLHFTRELIDRLRERGVRIAFITLHVGPGTFRPIASGDLSDHAMDAEKYVLGNNAIEEIRRAKDEGRPIIAVGTTVTRALEGCFCERGRLEPGPGSTELFITPGFEFQVIDGLLTNFHLPRSTLLCLVSALAGRERILKAYAKAVLRRYRFYSYGDAMLILPSFGAYGPRSANYL